MIDRTALYQDLVKREKEAGVRLTPQHRGIVIDAVLEWCRETKVNELNKSDVSGNEALRVTVLPTEAEIELKQKNGERLTSLEIFIMNHQPIDKAEAEMFRAQLLRVVGKTDH